MLKLYPEVLAGVEVGEAAEVAEGKVAVGAAGLAEAAEDLEVVSHLEVSPNYQLHRAR